MNKLVLIFTLFLSTTSLLGQNCSSTVIHFKSNKLRLKEHHTEIIDSIINSLSLDTNYLIEIHGHTDDKKTEEYNLDLGYKRAHSVATAIKAKRNNLVIIEKSFGESEPISKKDRENRRVQIFAVPINEDSTITIHGAFKETMKLNYRYFQYCGYCLSNPKITSTRPIGLYETDRDINVSIDLDCKSDINCYSVEYRFPYAYFNNSDSIMIPKPLYSYGCGTNLRDRDSLDVKKDERFEISYDTITNEYIITLDCFNPNYPGICCGTKPWPCPSHRLHFSKGQNIIYNAISKHRYQGDTLIRLGDSLLIKPKLCLNRLDTLYTIAFINILHQWGKFAVIQHLTGKVLLRSILMHTSIFKTINHFPIRTQR